MSSFKDDVEENMIVLFVGDDENLSEDSDENAQVPSPINIKIEPLDESGGDDNSEMEIFNSPALIGEGDIEEIEAEFLDEEYIKEEIEDNTEEFDTEYLEDDEMFEDSEEEYNIGKPKYITIKGKRRRIISLVDQLRESYSELADDKLLVKHLADIMRTKKAPPPPPNFCKVNVIHGEVTYECSYCGKNNGTLSWAARHYQFKHGDCYLSCYACGVQYRNTTNLYKHEKRCKAPDAALVLRARGSYLGCKGRGRPYTTKSRFITANTPPAKDKGRLFCSKCPASFSHRENLVAHENSHEGVRPFHCAHCNAKYTSKHALKRHEKALHGNEKFICAECNAVFPLKPALISHLDSHRTIRKYPCLYCPRRFSQKQALVHHTNKVHLNLPAAHACPACPKRYARMTHVKEHLNKVHGLTMITRRMYYQTLPIMDGLSKKTQYGKLVYNITPNVDQTVIHNANKNQLEKTDDDDDLPDWPETEYIQLDEQNQEDIDDMKLIFSETSHLTNLKEYIELDLTDNVAKGDAFIKHVIVKDNIITELNTMNDENDNNTDIECGEAMPSERLKKKQIIKKRQKMVNSDAGTSTPLSYTTIREVKEQIAKDIDEPDSTHNLQIKDENPNEKPTIVIEVGPHIDNEVDNVIEFEQEKESDYVVPEMIPTDDSVREEAINDSQAKVNKNDENPKVNTESVASEENEPISESKASEETKYLISDDAVQDWKVDKKHQVVAEFLQCIKSRKNSKRSPNINKEVPNLRRTIPARQNNWVKINRREMKPKDTTKEDCESATVTKLNNDVNKHDKIQTRSKLRRVNRESRNCFKNVRK